MEFHFNWYGYSYQEGLRIMRASYNSASEAVAADVERAKDEAIGYQEHLAQGGEWLGERDDDGVVIWDHDSVLEMRIESAEAAAMALRKAFVLALYHHWERSARGWTGSLHGKHPKLVAETLAKGYPVHERLTALQVLVNTLKHDNAHWGQQLVALWPEVLAAAPKPTGRTDWYELVRLTDAHVNAICDMLEGSGPKAMGA